MRRARLFRTDHRAGNPRLAAVGHRADRPYSRSQRRRSARQGGIDRKREEPGREPAASLPDPRSEEHTSELQSLMRISYAVFCLKKKNINNNTQTKHKIERLK